MNHIPKVHKWALIAITSIDQNQSIHIHTNQVARLYRKSLKTLSSWVIDRDIFLEEATKLRNRFDEERGCSNAKAVRLLKVRGESLRFFFTSLQDVCMNICCVHLLLFING